MDKYGLYCRVGVQKFEGRGGKDLHTIIARDFEAVKLFQTSFGLMKHTLGGDKKGCKNLEVPEFIFNSPTSVKVAFLAGLIDTDGWVSKYNELGICTKSFTFATQIISLINSMGLACTIEPTFNKTYNKYYYKVMPLHNTVLALFNLGIKNYMACSRKAANIIDKIPSPKKELFAKVRTVEQEEGDFTVYDITVEDVHEFRANNFTVHNCYSLGIRYGLRAGKLSRDLNITKEEAQEKIDKYFKAFPNLKKSMDGYLESAKKNGYVVNKFGRVRHLPEVKEIYDYFGDDIQDYSKMFNLAKKARMSYDEIKELSKRYNNLLNNALNFPIQSTAASIVNRAAIAMAKKFIELDLDAYIIAQIHDEIVVSCAEEIKHEVAAIVQDCMENTNKLSIKLIAKPEFAYNLRDGK